MRAELRIVISDQIFWSLLKRSCFSQLLGSPLIGWMSGYPYMNYFPGREFHDYKSVELPEEYISNRQKITGPNLRSMVFKKGAPVLTGWAGRSSLPHIFLN